jgi:hypothetical protein
MLMILLVVLLAGLCEQDAGFDAAVAVPAAQLSHGVGGAGECSAASECGGVFALQLHGAAGAVLVPSQCGHAGGPARVPVPQSQRCRLTRRLARNPQMIRHS